MSPVVGHAACRSYHLFAVEAGAQNPPVVISFYHMTSSAHINMHRAAPAIPGTGLFWWGSLPINLTQQEAATTKTQAKLEFITSTSTMGVNAICKELKRGEQESGAIDGRIEKVDKMSMTGVSSHHFGRVWVSQ